MLDRRVPGLSIWDTKRRKWKPDFFESGHDMFERSYTNLSSNRADQMIRVGSRAERLKETTRGWAASFGLLVMDMSDAQAEQLQPPGVGPRRLRHLRSRLRRQRGATIGARLARGRQVTARVAWAAVLTAAALSGCTATGAGETGPVAVPEAGPVSTQTPVFSSLSAKPGSTFTDGLALFSLRGGKPATVTAVRPDPVEGLELLGVRVAGGNRPMAAIQFTRSWPPVDPDLPPRRSATRPHTPRRQDRARTPSSC